MTATSPAETFTNALTDAIVAGVEAAGRTPALPAPAPEPVTLKFRFYNCSGDETAKAVLHHMDVASRNDVDFRCQYGRKPKVEVVHVGEPEDGWSDVTVQITRAA